MLLPQTAEYAIRAVLHLARADDVVRVPDLAAAIHVPQNYLAKTMHHMARSGLLRSTRGPAGGFRLAVPAAEATARGWAYHELEGGHFHMLVDPIAVADALLALLDQMTVTETNANAAGTTEPCVL